MFYLNATNPSVGEYEEAFEYMNTHVGKRFYVDAIGKCSSIVIRLGLKSTLLVQSKIAMNARSVNGQEINFGL